MGDISRRQYMSIESSLEMDPHFRMYGPFLNGVGDGGSRNGSDWAKDGRVFWISTRTMDVPGAALNSRASHA